MILYIHGFRSSSNSIKFKIIKNALKKIIGDHVFCPDLSHDPKELINFKQTGKYKYLIHY